MFVLLCNLIHLTGTLYLIIYCKFGNFCVLFSRNFAAKSGENKTLKKSLCHVLIDLLMPYSLILNVANMSFNAIRENKILMKISEFTVWFLY